MNEELDLVTFADEDGNEITMEVLDYFFYEGQEYALLAEAEECDCEEHECHEGGCECGCGCDDQREAFIMKVVPVGEDEEEFIPVDDEELAAKLIEVVETQLFGDEDDEEEEDEE